MKQAASQAAQRVKRLARPFGAGASFGGTALVVVVVAVTLGAQLPATRLLPAPPGLALALGRDGTLRFPEVTAGFLAQALGADTRAFLGPAPVAGPSTRPTPFVSGPQPSTGHPSPSPSPSPTPGPLPTLLHFAELSITMKADRAEVAPGDSITYSIVITDVGDRDFHGTYQVTSHIPFGTVDTTSPCGGTLGVDPLHGCVSPPVPTPGSPDSTAHQVSFTFTGTIAQGQRRVSTFTVRVDETSASGTRLSNHAHLDVIGDGKGAITSNTVVVVVSSPSPGV